jgi:hypothetical protein
MHVCMCGWTHVYTHTRTGCMYAYVYVCIHLCIYIYVYILYTRTRTHTHTCSYAGNAAGLRWCMHVCDCVIYIYAHTLYAGDAAGLGVVAVVEGRCNSLQELQPLSLRLQIRGFSPFISNSRLLCGKAAALA